METYDPETRYIVKLARVVKRGPFSYSPLHEIDMAGSLLVEIIETEGEEAIDYARPL